MAEKVTYKEPKNYFSPGMKKVAADWDKKNSSSSSKSSKSSKRSK